MKPTKVNITLSGGSSTAVRRHRITSTVNVTSGNPEVAVEINIGGVPDAKLVDYIHEQLRPLSAMLATQVFIAK